MRGLTTAALSLLTVSAALGLLYGSSNPTATLGSFSTSFDGRLLDQTHNAVLAAMKLDGAVIEPGAVLSFNDRVGSWSRDQGYRRAPVSFSGTLINEWGGGVCQTSTTLYNAGLLAGLEPVERHHHQFAANYVPPGRDAAVAYPNIDLRLKNPYPFPIRVKVRANNARMEIRFVGPGSPPSVQIQSNVIQVRQPGRLQLGHGPLARVRNPGKAGYQVQVTRLINGKTEWISQDSYPSMTRVVERLPASQ